MGDVTQILGAIERGRGDAARDLLPLVYDELKLLAAQRLRHEPPGQTLQPTALVHEAYLRLVGPADRDEWHGRAHFFAAAAEAMRRILIDSARRRGARKRGGGQVRVQLVDAVAPPDAPADNDLLALDEALSKLEREDPAKARLVKLHYFAGLSLEEAAAALDISRATAYRHWTYARAWLLYEVSGGTQDPTT